MTVEEKIEAGQETIYHELGHVLGYRLAVKDESTSLGELEVIKIGLKENLTQPKVNRYHIVGWPEITPELKEKNLSDPVNYMAWIIEVMLGCAVQSVFNKKSTIGGCYNIDKNGEFDLYNIKRLIDEDPPLFYHFEMYELGKYLIKMICDHEIVDKLEPIARYIKKDLLQSKNYQLEYKGTKLDKLTSKIDTIISDDLLEQYISIIGEFSKQIHRKD